METTTAPARITATDTYPDGWRSVLLAFGPNRATVAYHRDSQRLAVIVNGDHATAHREGCSHLAMVSRAVRLMADAGACVAAETFAHLLPEDEPEA